MAQLRPLKQLLKKRSGSPIFGTVWWDSTFSTAKQKLAERYSIAVSQFINNFLPKCYNPNKSNSFYDKKASKKSTKGKKAAGFYP